LKLGGSSLSGRRCSWTNPGSGVGWERGKKGAAQPMRTESRRWTALAAGGWIKEPLAPNDKSGRYAPHTMLAAHLREHDPDRWRAGDQGEEAWLRFAGGGVGSLSTCPPRRAMKGCFPLFDLGASREVGGPNSLRGGVPSGHRRKVRGQEARGDS